jgi:hypothetical protein
LAADLQAAALFSIASSGIYWLTLYPPKGSMTIHHLTFLAPFAVVLLPAITLVSDLMVRRNLDNADDILLVDTRPAFWLSSLALVTAGIWVLVIERIRWLVLKSRTRGKERKADAEPAKRWDPWSLWPWGK